MAENVALFLASRQKRLSYWLDRFKADELNSELKSLVTSLLKEYSAAITKAARSKDESEQSSLFDQLKVIDRKLGELFESRRLLTSKLGIAALSDCSTRGKGSVN